MTRFVPPSDVRPDGRPRGGGGLTYLGRVVTLSLLVAVGGWGAWQTFVRTSGETIRRIVEAKLQAVYAGRGVRVSVGEGRLHEGTGIELRNVVLVAEGNGLGGHSPPGTEIARLGMVCLQTDQSLDQIVLSGLDCREIQIQAAAIRLAADASGQLDYQSLLPMASGPMPMPWPQRVRISQSELRIESTAVRPVGSGQPILERSAPPGVSWSGRALTVYDIDMTIDLERLFTAEGAPGGNGATSPAPVTSPAGTAPSLSWMAPPTWPPPPDGSVPSSAPGSPKRANPVGGGPSAPPFRLLMEATGRSEACPTIRLRAVCDLPTGIWAGRVEAPDVQYGGDALDRLPPAWREALAPIPIERGRLNVIAHLSSEGQATGSPFSPLVAISGRLTEATCVAPMMELPFTEVDAQFELIADRLKIVTARGAVGGGRFVGTGWKQIGEGMPFGFRCRVRDFHLDDRTEAQLPPPLRDKLATVSPRGLFDCDWTCEGTIQRYDPSQPSQAATDGTRAALKGRLPARSVGSVQGLHPPGSGGTGTGGFCTELTHKAEILCREMAFTWANFPYPVHGASGRIELDGDTMTVDLTGLVSGQTTTFQGTLNDPGPEATGRFRVVTERTIPVDETLLTAVAGHQAAVADLLRQANPRGQVGLHATWARNRPDDPHPLTIDVTLDDVSVRHDRFPYPLRNVRGRLALQGGVWSTSGLTGRNAGAFLTVGGTFTPHADGGVMVVHLDGEDVPLDETLHAALPESVQQAWRALRPRGAIDQLSLDATYDTRVGTWDVTLDAEKFPPDVRATSTTIAIEPTFFPFRLEDVTGKFRYHRGVVELTEMDCRHGAQRIGGRGRLVLAPEGWAFILDHFAAERVTLDYDVLRACPMTMRRALERLGVRGLLNVGGAFRVFQTGQDEPSAAWDLAIDLENGELTFRDDVKHIHGGVRLTGGSGPDGLASRGELRIDSLLWRDIQITGITGPVWIDSGQALFGTYALPKDSPEARPVTARVAGGTAAANAQILFDDEASFFVAADLAGVDQPTLMAELGQRDRAVGGRLDGHVSLAGKSRSLHTLRGEGEFTLTDAGSKEVPVLVSLVQDPGQASGGMTIAGAEVKFQIEASHVYLHHVKVFGEAVTLQGNGEVGFDRQVHLTFHALLGQQRFEIPVISQFLAGASRQLLEIQVTGTLDQPSIKRKTLPLVKDSLDKAFPDRGQGFSRTAGRNAPPRG